MACAFVCPTEDSDYVYQDVALDSIWGCLVNIFSQRNDHSNKTDLLKEPWLVVMVEQLS